MTTTALVPVDIDLVTELKRRGMFTQAIEVVRNWHKYMDNQRLNDEKEQRRRKSNIYNYKKRYAKLHDLDFIDGKIVQQVDTP